jgi:hypothetical protein
VRHFNFQSELNAKQKLKEAEDKLLEFNKRTNIINYEQSKAVAVVKEDMEVLFRSKKSRVSRSSSCNKTIRRKIKNTRCYSRTK